MRDGDTETSFDLGYPDSPLQPFDDPATYGRSFKDKIVVIEGVDVLSDTNAHNSAGTILTGSRIVGGDGGLPWNSSLDQFLAVEQRLGDATLIPSIALAVGSKQLSARETLSFGTGGVPISKIIDPGVAFDFLFKHAIVGADPAAQARATREQRLGQSLIDFARDDVERLRARVGPFEVQKLDQHLDALRALEKKRQALSLPDGCTLPDRPRAFPHLERYNGGEPYFDAITDLHIDLLALAMSCDITRFGTLVMNDLSYAGNPLGLPEDNHGAMAHTYSASALGSSGHPVGAGNPATWKLLAKFNRYVYGKVARLLSAPRRVRHSRQHPRLRLERHGEPRHAQHAQRPHRSSRRPRRQNPHGSPHPVSNRLPPRHLVRPERQRLPDGTEQLAPGLHRASLRRRPRLLRHPGRSSVLERHAARALASTTRVPGYWAPG